MQGLKRRSEFVAAARGKRVTRPGFVLQAARTDPAVSHPPRFGYTVTRKTGTAVVRNRIRRRLRQAVRAGAEGAENSTNYVLIGRRAALTLPFERLCADLRSGLADLSAAMQARDKVR